MLFGDDGVDTAMNCLVKASTLLTLLAWLNFFQVQNIFEQLLQYIFLLHGCVPSGFSMFFQRNKKLATDGNCLISTVQLITTLESRNKTNYFKPIIVGKKSYPLVLELQAWPMIVKITRTATFSTVRFKTSQNLRFRHHDTRQRMHLVLTSLPLRRKSNSTKLAIMSTWIWNTITTTIGSMGPELFTYYMNGWFFMVNSSVNIPYMEWILWDRLPNTQVFGF